MERNPEKLLRSLPRNAASPDFTEGVMRKLDSVPPRRVASGLIAASLGALLITALAGGQYVQMRKDEARLDALRAEQRRIASELEELKKITSAWEPVLYVGGTEEIDLYVDLREPDRRSGDVGIQPASERLTTDF